MVYSEQVTMLKVRGTGHAASWRLLFHARKSIPGRKTLFAANLVGTRLACFLAFDAVSQPAPISGASMVGGDVGAA